MSATLRFPFTAVVGADDAKLALLLAAVDARIGGVLLRGQKGSAKSTLARGLAVLLPGDAPFAELPVGATEDRLIGTLDIGAALTDGTRTFEPGLLAQAHGGVLYVDEVNLLPDHLVDVLLDVAASGINRIEREGISHQHPARFVLIGSMNPEEGELRPQLLDRFGLAVDVAASTEPNVRVEAVQRRLAFDAHPDQFAARWKSDEDRIRHALQGASSAAVPDELLAAIATLCVSVGAEGLRADLVIARAAAALAGLDGRAAATDHDVRRVAPFALAHRRRRNPFDEPGIDDNELAEALDDAFAPAESPDDAPAEPDPPTPPTVAFLPTGRVDNGARGRRATSIGDRGRFVRATEADGPIRSLAVTATARAAAARRARTPGETEPVTTDDLRQAVRVERAGSLVVIAVDASGSMGARRRMEAAKGAVLGLLLDAYQRRDRVALVAFRGDDAEVLLRPTGSIEVARARLADLPTGGRTPLAAGIEAALRVATTSDRAAPLVVLVTDGRATAGTDPVESAIAAATEVRRRGVSAVVIDAEDGSAPLGLARQLADAMAARYLRLPDLSAPTLERTIREAIN